MDIGALPHGRANAPEISNTQLPHHYQGPGFISFELQIQVLFVFSQPIIASNHIRIFLIVD